MTAGDSSAYLDDHTEQDPEEGSRETVERELARKGKYGQPDAESVTADRPTRGRHQGPRPPSPRLSGSLSRNWPAGWRLRSNIERRGSAPKGRPSPIGPLYFNIPSTQAAASAFSISDIVCP